MRNILYILLLATLTSCEVTVYHAYVVKNETEYRISISAFDRIILCDSIAEDSEISYEIIYVEPNSEYMVLKATGYHYDLPGIFESDNMLYDSLTITFDSDRRIIYACRFPSSIYCSDKYNLMNYEESFIKVKTGMESGHNEYTYTYTFTEEDYEYASTIDSIK